MKQDAHSVLGYWLRRLERGSIARQAMKTRWDGRPPGVLLDEPATHFSEDELAREMGWSAGRVTDVLAELERAGLVNRHGRFALPPVQPYAASNSRLNLPRCTR
jgi:hypothetical protein